MHIANYYISKTPPLPFLGLLFCHKARMERYWQQQPPKPKRPYNTPFHMIDFEVVSFLHMNATAQFPIISGPIISVQELCASQDPAAGCRQIPASTP